MTKASFQFEPDRQSCSKVRLVGWHRAGGASIPPRPGIAHRGGLNVRQLQVATAPARPTLRPDSNREACGPHPLHLQKQGKRAVLPKSAENCTAMRAEPSTRQPNHKSFEGKTSYIGPQSAFRWCQEENSNQLRVYIRQISVVSTPVYTNSSAYSFVSTPVYKRGRIEVEV